MQREGSGLLFEKRGKPHRIDMKIEKELEENNCNNKTNDDLILEVKKLRAEVRRAYKQRKGSGGKLFKV